MIISVALWDCLFGWLLLSLWIFHSISLPSLFSSYIMYLSFALPQITLVRVFALALIFMYPLSLWQTCYCGVCTPHVETMTLIKLAQFYLWNTDAASENCSSANIAYEGFKLAHTKVLSCDIFFPGWWCTAFSGQNMQSLSWGVFLFKMCYFVSGIHMEKFNIDNLSSSKMVINSVLSA